MKRSLITLTLLLTTSTAMAKPAGRTGAGFLKLGASAKGMAMGEAYSALVEDASAIYWNPAALAGSKNKMLTLMHGDHVDDSTYEFLGYAQRSGRSGFGAGVQYFSYGEIDQLDTIGEKTGSVEPKDMAISVGYATTFFGYKLGAAVKHVDSKLVNSDSTFAIDLGAQSPLFKQRRLNFAGTITNLGGTLNYENDDTDLPLMSRLGAGYRMQKNWDIEADVVFPNDEDDFLALGTEYRIPIFKGANLALRGGFNTKEAGAGSGLSGGMGFRLPRVDVDFALVSMGDLGMVYRLSADFRLFRLPILDENGQPLDSDKDGIPDAFDECADTPAGTKVDDRGCKLKIDSDKDGILDDDDECPDTVKGTKVDSTGCEATVKHIDDSLVLNEVHFDNNSAEIRPEGRKVLDEVAEALKIRSKLHIEIQGHSDSWGDPNYNLDLSSRRAFGVKSYLILKGVAEDRLTSKGYGEANPSADNSTREGRAQNRRIEFKILH